MAAADPIIGTVGQGDSPDLFRTVNVLGGDGADRLATAADFTAVRYRVFDYQTGELTETPVGLDQDAVFPNTVPDSGAFSGANFVFQLDGATYLAAGNRLRIVRVTFTLTGGRSFSREWHLWTENQEG